MMPPKMNNQTKLHLPYLEGIRGLCALYVVMHHVVLQFITPVDDKVFKYTYAFFKQGHYAVDIFIVISGYCLMLPLTRGNNYTLKPDFLLKRAKRIYLPYLLAMVLALVLINTLIGYKTSNYWDLSLPVTTKAIVLHLFLLHDIFKDTVYRINYPFWSISVECRIYVLFPLLLLVWRRFGILPTLLSSIVIAIIFWVISLSGGNNIALDSSGVNPYIILFCLGMIAAEFTFNPARNITPIQTAAAAMISIAITAAGLWLKKHHNSYLVEELIDLGIGSVFFAALLYIRNHSWLQKALSVKPLAFLGTFAYSIYLLHGMFIQLIWKYLLPAGLGPREQFYGSIFIGVPVILTAAYLFYLTCERPFMNRKPQTHQTKKAPVMELSN